jgi:predicted RNase H-like HicB family nuclease
MAMRLTAVFEKVPEGYIGFVEELPGAKTQGATLEEARANSQGSCRVSVESKPDVGPGASRGPAGHS